MRAANRGNARSQHEFGFFHFMSASRLEMLQGAMVTARWAEALRLTEMAAELGVSRLRNHGASL